MKLSSYVDAGKENDRSGKPVPDNTRKVSCREMRYRKNRCDESQNAVIRRDENVETGDGALPASLRDSGGAPSFQFVGSGRRGP